MKYKIAQYVGYKGFNANPIISLLQLLKIWDLFSSLSEFRVAFAKIKDIKSFTSTNTEFYQGLLSIQCAENFSW